MFTLDGLRARRSPFILTFNGDGGADGGGGSSNGGGDNSGDGKGGRSPETNSPNFPANTPRADMTPEQQIAYDRWQGRKHEERLRGFGDWTPEKIKALEKERDELRDKGLSDAEKAIEAAKEEGRAEVRAVLNRERATTALQKALEGRVPDAGALLALDVNTFIVEGKVDAAAVKAWAEDNSTEAGKPQQQKKHVDLGQGHRSQVTASAGDRGRSEAARRFNRDKKTD